MSVVLMPVVSPRETRQEVERRVVQLSGLRQGLPTLHPAQGRCPHDSRKCARIRRAHLHHRPLSGYIFVDFSSEEEVKKALKCNREYMGKEPQVAAVTECTSVCAWGALCILRQP